MTLETRIALFLLNELISALHTNDPDTFKRWLNRLWAPAPDRQVPWDVTASAKYDSATDRLQCDRWAGWLRRQHPTIQLCDLRHAWAIRSIAMNLNASLAAKCMGHDIAVHHRTYHRWIAHADIAAVAAGLKGS